MEVGAKPFMKTWKDGKPFFSWKKKGAYRATHLYKMLIGHIVQHFIAHNKDASYSPTNKERVHLARTFTRYLSEIYANVDEMHFRAVEQQVNWLFTKQDVFATKTGHKSCVQLHFIGRNLFEELLK